MNTIGLLLVLGLAFFALKQKSEKTRNMLLIASALLGFCMFSAEGFTTTPDSWNPSLCAAEQGTPGGTAPTTVDIATCAGGATQATCTSIDATGVATGEDGSLSTGVTCAWGILTAEANITSADGKIYTFPPGFNVTTGELPANTTIATTGTAACTVVQTPSTATDDLSEATVATIYPCDPGDGDGVVPGAPDASSAALNPCNCLNTVSGPGNGEKNLYCNSGWLQGTTVKFMDAAGTPTGTRAEAVTCDDGWASSLGFSLGIIDWSGKCTMPVDSSGGMIGQACPPPPAATPAT